MPKTAAAKKTSEERCREAFDAWRGEPINDPELGRMISDGFNQVAWTTWQACWRYLESRVTEFVES